MSLFNLTGFGHPLPDGLFVFLQQLSSVFLYPDNLCYDPDYLTQPDPCLTLWSLNFGLEFGFCYVDEAESKKLFIGKDFRLTHPTPQTFTSYFSLAVSL